MIKRRQDGNTFMVMFSGFQSTSLSFQQPLVLVLSYSHCKNLLIALSPCADVFFHIVMNVILYFFMLVQYNLHFYACTGWCVLSI